MTATGTVTRWVGRAVARPDVPPKIDGSFLFSNDVYVPRMLYGATVRSTHAHARVLSVDVRAAFARPGVVSVLTIDDVPGARLVGHIVADQPVFADGVVRYYGEPVAFVVARSQEEAWTAADAVNVSYDARAVLDDPERALDGDAPLLHSRGNLVSRAHLKRGAIVPAAVEASGVWRTGRQDQAFLGLESAVALPDPDGGVTLRLATQDLHSDRVQIAAALGLDEHLVRMVNEGIGGAFGGREDITLQIHLCLAALKSGRAVKTTYRRGESFLAHPKRHPARLWYTIGADTDGRLGYVWARILLDGGAYASTSGPVLVTACSMAAGPYKVKAVDIAGESVYTNNPTAGAMRGFGAVQACFGMESTMDLLAAKLGMDPVELRRRNALQPGDEFPTTGQRVGPSAPVRELIDRCAALPLPPAQAIDHPYRWPGGTGLTTRGEGVKRGVGFALGVKNTMYAGGFPDVASATVRVSRSGIEVLSAAAECGQGIGSALVQIVAEVFGRPEWPVWLGPCTTEAGYAGASSASRQTWMSGSAVKRAAERALLGLRGRGLDELGEEIIEVEETYRAPRTEAGDPRSGQGDLHVAWMFVAHRAVVDVDTELGLVKVVQVATAQDVGYALNPREVRGQITGGISQGVGLALTEHLDAIAGVPRNATFTDYLMPTAADMPDIEVVLVEVPEADGPFGLKGAGEPPSVSSTAAVAAAIRAATGRPVMRVPVRPDDLI